jgi:hypothetical protein
VQDESVKRFNEAHEIPAHPHGFPHVGDYKTLREELAAIYTQCSAGSRLLVEERQLHEQTCADHKVMMSRQAIMRAEGTKSGKWDANNLRVAKTCADEAKAALSRAPAAVEAINCAEKFWMRHKQAADCFWLMLNFLERAEQASDVHIRFRHCADFEICEQYLSHIEPAYAPFGIAGNGLPQRLNKLAH